MLDAINSGRVPFFWVFLFFFCGAMMRGQTVYWVARLGTTQALKRMRPKEGVRLRIHQWLSADEAGRGRAVLNRWGLPAISFAYLTVGLQSMILAAAGVTRVKWHAFTLAQIPGACAWGLIYSTVGFAVWKAMWHAAVSGHPLITVAVVVVIVAAIVLLVYYERAKRHQTQQHSEDPVGIV